MTSSITTVALRYENDVVLGRQRARQIASLLGFESQDQTRIATAVSEVARNAFRYARGGQIEFSLEGRSLPQVLVVRVIDQGAGIKNLERILQGGYESPTGMGLGLLGARRLMDQFEVDTGDGRGTTVVLKKLLVRQAKLFGPEDIAEIVTELSRERAQDPIGEIRQQNQELLRALEELSRRQEDLVALNRELEDTNRGVVALYAELDERADHLRRADELKSRFLSNMSHEFRTPVNSIQALARMLLDRIDGDLTAEQERQVGFIRKAADALAELVSDLLDLAKVEAGKIVVRPVEFEVANLFGALRGMLRPLLVNESVNLVFDEPRAIPPLLTDEAKVSQILRNFISNALKFTEQGEVRVSARIVGDRTLVEFAVADTGIGIAEGDQERIFQEFSQVDNPVQRRVKGTGLGLPLCQKLAQLLGGTITVESRPHHGSTFKAILPIIHQSAASTTAGSWTVDPNRLAVLVVEDSPEMLLIYEKYLRDTDFQMLAARSLREARDALAAVTPRAIVLDILLSGEDSWTFLTELKRRPQTERIPVVVVTRVDDAGKGIALGADAYCVKPIDRQELVKTLMRLAASEATRKILIIDDEEISRYVLHQHLTKPQHLLLEAHCGEEGLLVARDQVPDLICLDLSMPDVDGFEVLRRLKTDPITSHIPVVIVTSSVIEEEARARLLGAAAVVTKDLVSKLSATVEQALGEGRAA